MITVTISILAIIGLASFGTLARAWKRAPNGYEDQFGFFLGRTSGIEPAILAVSASMDGYDHGAEILSDEGAPTGVGSCSDLATDRLAQLQS
jgi:hypothetical protein